MKKIHTNFASSNVIEEHETTLVASVSVGKSTSEVKVICGVCGKCFDNEKECTEHNGSVKFRCKECKIDFQMELDLEWHTVTNHEIFKHPESNLVECKRCGIQFNDTNQLKVHELTTHMSIVLRFLV